VQCRHGAKDDGVKRLDRKDRHFEVNDKRLGIPHLGMKIIEETLTKDFFYLLIAQTLIT
jgi:hypothetical protein